MSLVMGSVAILLLSSYLLSPSPIGKLIDPGLWDFEEHWTGFGIELLTLVIIVAALRYGKRNAIAETTAVVFGLITVCAPITVIIIGNLSTDSVKHWENGQKQTQAKSAPGPNVYHLIFDAYDGKLFSRVVEEEQLADLFRGFVFYENAMANYSWTQLSIPSTMIGKKLDSRITIEGVRSIARTSGLINTLDKRGYRVSQFSAHFINNHEQTHFRRSTVSLETELYGNFRHLVQLLDLSLFMSAPSRLKAETTINGRGPFSHWFLRYTNNIADWTRNTPWLSLALFEETIRSLNTMPRHGQYVWGHYLIPHVPAYLSANCGYEPERERKQPALIDQIVCVTRKIGEFAQVLRSHGAFEDALIVIHSDHGTLDKTRPLLLVKYPGEHSEPLKVARHHVQLLDVMPTILGTLEMPLESSEGEPLDGVALWRTDPKLRGTIITHVAAPK